jgi:hypothetical protein
MKKIYLLAISLCISLFSYGQCPPGNIGLLSQSDIDNFALDYPGCTQLNNALGISGNSVTNLNGLSQIEGIGTTGAGGPLIISCPNLTNLSGLDNLTFVGGSVSIANTGITNFNGLGSLVNVRGTINIDGNPNIVDFTGLDALEFAEGLQAINCEQLISFNGLGVIVPEFFPSSINISSNPNLPNLNGLEGWQQVGNFTVSDNAILNSIDAVADMELFGTINIIISDNPNLSFCAIEMVCNSFQDPVIVHIINNNASGCNSENEVEAQCDLGTEEVSLQELVSVFPNPVSDFLKIILVDEIQFNYARLYSVLGEELFTTSDKSIDVSNLSEGIYFLKIVTSQGQLVRRIIKN